MPRSPSPSLKQKQFVTQEDGTERERHREDYSSGSLAGSIASGSSGFGSLPKKRPALLNSGQSLDCIALLRATFPSQAAT